MYLKNILRKLGYHTIPRHLQFGPQPLSPCFYIDLQYYQIVVPTKISLAPSSVYHVPFRHSVVALSFLTIAPGYGEYIYHFTEPSNPSYTKTLVSNHTYSVLGGEFIMVSKEHTNKNHPCRNTFIYITLYMSS